jgi:hypothetical protein
MTLGLRRVHRVRSIEVTFAHIYQMIIIEATVNLIVVIC